MEARLQARCEAFNRRYQTVRKFKAMNSESLAAICAIGYLNAEAEPDRGRFEECRAILKKHAGMFSDMRGLVEPLLVCKMALAADPEAYIEEVTSAHEAFSKNYGGAFDVLSAMNIVDSVASGDVAATAQRAQAMYEAMRADHPVMMAMSNSAFAAVMAANGQDPLALCDEVEECYRQLQPRFRLAGEWLHDIAEILSLSERPAAQKVTDFVEMREALAAAGVKFAGDHTLAIVAALAVAEVPVQRTAGEIAEVDAWLKRQKGFGAFGVERRLRHVFASLLVLQDYNEKAGAGAAADAVSLAAAQQAVMTVVVAMVMMVIMTGIITTNNVNAMNG